MIHVVIVACNDIMYEIIQDYCEKSKEKIHAFRCDSKEEAIARKEDIDLWIHEDTHHVFLSVAHDTNYEKDAHILLWSDRKPIRIENLYGMLDQYYIIMLHNKGQKRIQMGRFFLDIRKKTLFDSVSDDAMFLTEKEAALLYHLHIHQQKPISKASIVKNIWGYHAENNSHTVETHLYRLRQKMMSYGIENAFIHTPQGYQLHADFRS